jgi:hypothetical protein
MTDAYVIADKIPAAKPSSPDDLHGVTWACSTACR